MASLAEAYISILDGILRTMFSFQPDADDDRQEGGRGWNVSLFMDWQNDLPGWISCIRFLPSSNSVNGSEGTSQSRCAIEVGLSLLW